MGVIAAAAITAAATVGTAVYTNQQQKKAAAKAAAANKAGIPDFSGIKMPEEVDVWGESMRALDYNATTGFNRAKSIASRSNDAAVTDLEKAMGRLFGGDGEFDEQRDLTNSMIEDHLQGRLSDSTRADVGRRLLASGATNLGGGAVDDAYTGYLGLTKEGLQEQGTQEYRSLYSMYRQAVPLTTPVEAMRYTTLDPAAIVQAQQTESMNQFNAAIALRGAQYQVGYNNQQMNVASMRDRAAANQQTTAAIGQAVGSIAGAYAGSRTGTSNSSNTQITPVSNGGTTAYGGQITGYYSNQSGQWGTVARATAV